MSRTSEIPQMSLSVRPSIDPAEIGGSPTRGTHCALGLSGALGLPGAPAGGAAPAPAARRGGV
ncbi:hypothetical protein [Streptomyces sp. NPDC092307]|uniref:hypothetical protein n=1 Tax=Streptomyces sp. NPDC092307 TaxID=3366013 RepID=UPI0037FA07A0